MWRSSSKILPRQPSGTALRHTHVAGPMGDMMFATGPDGTRLELLEKKDPA
jgi:hypothetical protein